MPPTFRPPIGVFLFVAVAPAAAMEPLTGAERARAIARTCCELASNTNCQDRDEGKQGKAPGTFQDLAV